jgi:hypothetical protein
MDESARLRPTEGDPVGFAQATTPEAFARCVRGVNDSNRLAEVLLASPDTWAGDQARKALSRALSDGTIPTLFKSLIAPTNQGVNLVWVNLLMRALPSAPTPLLGWRWMSSAANNAFSSSKLSGPLAKREFRLWPALDPVGCSPDEIQEIWAIRLSLTGGASKEGWLERLANLTNRELFDREVALRTPAELARGAWSGIMGEDLHVAARHRLLSVGQLQNDPASVKLVANLTAVLDAPPEADIEDLSGAYQGISRMLSALERYAVLVDAAPPEPFAAFARQAIAAQQGGTPPSQAYPTLVSFFRRQDLGEVATISLEDGLASPPKPKF